MKIHKISYICKEIFKDKYENDKKYRKVGGNFYYTDEYRGASYSISILKYSKPKEIAIIFHNGSNYDYQFTI